MDLRAMHICLSLCFSWGIFQTVNRDSTLDPSRRGDTLGYQTAFFRCSLSNLLVASHQGTVLWLAVGAVRSKLKGPDHLKHCTSSTVLMHYNSINCSRYCLLHCSITCFKPSDLNLAVENEHKFFLDQRASAHFHVHWENEKTVTSTVLITAPTRAYSNYQNKTDKNFNHPYR
jgi:hypothetical protein